MMTVIEKQTMDAIIAINRKTKDANQIDWEQRRYEIAKDVMAAQMSNSNPNIHGYAPYTIARYSVEWADALVDALKVKSEQK